MSLLKIIMINFLEMENFHFKIKINLSDDEIPVVRPTRRLPEMLNKN